MFRALLCSSSEGRNCIIQHLVSSHRKKQSSTCFEHYVLIIRRSNLYYTASGIITLKKVLYMFRALCAHHQEVKFVLYSIWYHHTETSPLHASSTMYSSSGRQNCIIQHLVSSHWNKSSTCFEHYVLIIRRSKLYYTASGIVTLKTSPLHVSSIMCSSSGGQNGIIQHLVSH